MRKFVVACCGIVACTPVKQPAIEAVSLSNLTEQKALEVRGADFEWNPLALKAGAVQSTTQFLFKRNDVPTAERLKRLAAGEVSALGHAIVQPVVLPNGIVVSPPGWRSEFIQFISQDTSGEKSKERRLLEGLIRYKYFDESSKLHRILAEKFLPNEDLLKDAHFEECRTEDGFCNKCIVQCGLFVKSYSDESTAPSTVVRNCQHEAHTTTLENSSLFSKAVCEHDYRTVRYPALLLPSMIPIIRTRRILKPLNHAQPGEAKLRYQCAHTVVPELGCYFVEMQEDACLGVKIQLTGGSHATTHINATAKRINPATEWALENLAFPSEYSESRTSGSVTIHAPAFTGNSIETTDVTDSSVTLVEEACSQEDAHITCSISVGVSVTPAGPKPSYPGCKITGGISCSTKLPTDWFDWPDYHSNSSSVNGDYRTQYEEFTYIEYNGNTYENKPLNGVSKIKVERMVALDLPDRDVKPAVYAEGSVYARAGSTTSIGSIGVNRESRTEGATVVIVDEDRGGSYSLNCGTLTKAEEYTPSTFTTDAGPPDVGICEPPLQPCEACGEPGNNGVCVNPDDPGDDSYRCSEGKCRFIGDYPVPYCNEQTPCCSDKVCFNNSCLSEAPADAGPDAGPDSGSDAGPDSGSDAGQGHVPDAGQVEAGIGIGGYCDSDFNCDDDCCVDNHCVLCPDAGGGGVPAIDAGEAEAGNEPHEICAENNDCHNIRRPCCGMNMVCEPCG